MAETTLFYQELIEAIIQKQATVLGSAVAVRRARNVEGLEVSDDGKVITMAGSGPKVLELLVEQYRALSGSIGVNFCRQAVASWRSAHPDVPLPAILV